MRGHQFSIPGRQPLEFLDCKTIKAYRRDRLVPRWSWSWPWLACFNCRFKTHDESRMRAQGPIPSCRVWWICSALYVIVRLTTRGPSQAVSEISWYMIHLCHSRCRSPSWGGRASTAPDSLFDRAWVLGFIGGDKSTQQAESYPHTYIYDSCCLLTRTRSQVDSCRVVFWELSRRGRWRIGWRQDKIGIQQGWWDEWRLHPHHWTFPSSHDSSNENNE